LTPACPTSAETSVPAHHGIERRAEKRNPRKWRETIYEYFLSLRGLRTFA
jgi:hypothetical protein